MQMFKNKAYWAKLKRAFLKELNFFNTIIVSGSIGMSYFLVSLAGPKEPYPSRQESLLAQPELPKQEKENELREIRKEVLENFDPDDREKIEALSQKWLDKKPNP